MTDDIWTQPIFLSIVYYIHRVEERQHTREVASVFLEYTEDMDVWFCISLPYVLWVCPFLIVKSKTTAAVVFFNYQIAALYYAFGEMI